MDQGRPLEGARAHYDFLLTTVKWIKVSCCKVVEKFIKRGFLDASLVHGLETCFNVTQLKNSYQS